MEIKKISNKLKCDFPGCKNLADISIGDQLDKNKTFNLCEDCKSKIYECIAKTIVPKGISAPFKKEVKLK